MNNLKPLIMRKSKNYIAWIILILLAVLLAYIGVRALHFNYPIMFISLIIVCSAIVILLFSLLKPVD